MKTIPFAAAILLSLAACGNAGDTPQAEGEPQGVVQQLWLETKTFVQGLLGEHQQTVKDLSTLLPQEQLDELKAKLDNIQNFPDNLVNNAMNAEELQQLKAFIDTPTGQKFVESLTGEQRQKLDEALADQGGTVEQAQPNAPN